MAEMATECQVGIGLRQPPGTVLYSNVCTCKHCLSRTEEDKMKMQN